LEEETGAAGKLEKKGDFQDKDKWIAEKDRLRLEAAKKAADAVTQLTEGIVQTYL
jgi:hypothetical protein